MIVRQLTKLPIRQLTNCRYTNPVSSPAHLAQLIRVEYRAFPGLKLTREQACRLWSVPAESCSQALKILVHERFLHQTATGKYVALPAPSGAAAAVESRRSKQSA